MKSQRAGTLNIWWLLDGFLNVNTVWFGIGTNIIAGENCLGRMEWNRLTSNSIQVRV